MDMQAPDVDTLDVLKQFLGQTYGELHKLDSNIIGTTQHLTRKSDDFKQVASKVLADAVPQVVSNRPAVHTAGMHVSLPVTTAEKLPQDDNQMEFSFDGSATAKSIQRALDRIESKLEKLERIVIKS